MSVANLPALPPLPRKDDSRAVSGETARTTSARLACALSLPPKLVECRNDAHEERVVFLCAGCGHETPWWSEANSKKTGPPYGRFETGDTQAVFVRDKTTKKLRRIVVNVTVVGRVCGKCTTTLPGFRTTQEPAVTQLPDKKGD